MAAEGAKSGNHPSCFNHYHNTIAETTLILLLGQVSRVPFSFGLYESFLSLHGVVLSSLGAV